MPLNLWTILAQKHEHNMSIKFEHWPLHEIPTLVSYLTSQVSSAVMLLARIVHGDSNTLDGLWIPQIMYAVVYVTHIEETAVPQHKWNLRHTKRRMSHGKLSAQICQMHRDKCSADLWVSTIWNSRPVIGPGRSLRRCWHLLSWAGNTRLSIPRFDPWSLVRVITFRCHFFVAHSAYPSFWGLVDANYRSASICIVSAMILRHVTNFSASNTGHISKNGCNMEQYQSRMISRTLSIQPVPQ